MTNLSGYRLADRAMLVSLSIKAWGGQRLDQGETRRVADDNKAAKNAVRVTKDLVGDALDPVRQSERAMREVHRRYTLPWADDQTRLLPTKVWEEYQQEMGALVRNHEDKVIPSFVSRYHTEVIPGARQRLGSLFRAEDFPADVSNKFGVSLRFLPVPEAGDVRVKMSDVEIKALRQEVEDATREAFELANRDIMDRLTAPLSRLAEAMREYGPGKRLSKALLENVADIASLAPDLDLTGRPEVSALAEEINALVTDRSAPMLAANPRARASVAAEADRLIAKIANIF